jgi:hypothetical protein
MKVYSRLYEESCTPELIGEFQDLVHQILLITAGTGRLRYELLPFLQTEWNVNNRVYAAENCTASKSGKQICQ